MNEYVISVQYVIKTKNLDQEATLILYHNLIKKRFVECDSRNLQQPRCQK